MTTLGLPAVLLLRERLSSIEVAATTGIAEAIVSAMRADRRGSGKVARARLATDFEVKPARFMVE